MGFQTHVAGWMQSPYPISLRWILLFLYYLIFLHLVQNIRYVLKNIQNRYVVRTRITKLGPLKKYATHIVPNAKLGDIDDLPLPDWYPWSAL